MIFNETEPGGLIDKLFVRTIVAAITNDCFLM
jgi:hypothetical protein